MLPKQKFFFSQTNPHIEGYATMQSKGLYFKLGLPVGTIVCERPINKRGSISGLDITRDQITGWFRLVQLTRPT